MIAGSCICGAVRWRFDGTPDGATACSCTACRRYGVLWAYGYEGEGIAVSGPTQAYVRGKVNLRLADPGAVADIPIDHFDGLDAWADLPRDGRCVRDYWF